MLTQALIFVLETFFGLFALCLLLRFFLQLMRAPARNPLSYFLGALTDFIVVPVRRTVPGVGGLDLSTLILSWLCEFVLIALVRWVQGADFGPAVGTVLVVLGLLAAVRLVRWLIYVVMVAVIAQALLTWVSPYSPAMPVLNSLARPFLRIFQRRIPPIGNVDLSPLFVLVVCQLLLILVVAWLEGALIAALRPSF